MAGYADIKSVVKETLFSGITVVGGAALAFYTYQNSANQIWPVAYSVASGLGTYNIIRNICKYRRSAWYGNMYSRMNVANGTFVYFSSLYAFSESWKCRNPFWIPCLGTAACGLYFAYSSIPRTKSVFDLKPFSKLCELAFKPGLIGLGATYLVYFRNHDEEFLQWMPLVLIFCNSLLDIATGTIIEPSADEPKLLLLKGIELLMGGSLLAASSTALTVYFTVKKYHWALRAYMGSASFGSTFSLFASILCFQQYIGMTQEVLYFFAGLTTGFAIVSWSGLMVQYLGNMTIKHLFPILTASGYCLLCVSAYYILQVISRPVANRYFQRTLGPLLTMSSTVASAYVGYHMGWRYSLMMFPLPCAGIYVAYKSFRRGKAW